MAYTEGGTRLVLEPKDEYCHEPDDAANYNESMYFNAYDPVRRVGGWFRLGNRVNEGYAEMSCCVYLPEIGFVSISRHAASILARRFKGCHLEILARRSREQCKNCNFRRAGSYT